MKYTIKNVREDEYVKEFLDASPLKESTIKNYCIHIASFCNYLQKNPKEFILEAEREQDEGLKSRLRSIKKYLNGFRRWMDEEKNFTALTISRSIGSVKSFYRFFDIEIPRTKLKPALPSGLQDLPTMEEVKKVVRSASNRDRALVLFSLSSGLARNEIMKIKYVDFLTAINAPLSTPVEELRDKIHKDTIPTFFLNREKVNDFEFVTFCSPEACTAIVDYLEKRKVKSEWLFTNDKGVQLKNRTYESIFQRLNDRNNLGFKKNGKSRRLTSHQMRRVFATNLLGAGISQTSIDFMMAHSIGPIAEAYFKLDPEVLKREYIRGLDAITIERINVIDFDSAEVQKMKNEMVEMKKKMEQQAKELELQKNIMSEIQRFGKLPK